MAGFLYFRSGDTRIVDLETVKKYWLGYAFARVESRPVSQNSPSGAAGIVFQDPEQNAPRSAMVNLEEQRWVKMPEVDGRPLLYVGYWLDAKPTPEDLAVPKMLRGDKVRLADGHWWQVPLVRQVNEATSDFECALPRRWTLDERGQWTHGDIVEQFAYLWQLTAPFATRQALVDGREEDAPPIENIPDPEALRVATELLKVNYRVDAAELMLLGVFDETQATNLVPLVANHYSWFQEKLEELLKKNVPPSTSTGSISANGGAD